MFKNKSIFKLSSPPNKENAKEYTSIALVKQITGLCGVPTEENWKGVTELPNYNTFKFQNPLPVRRVKQEFKQYGEDTADLIDELLQLNPQKRFSAKEALDHDFFWQDVEP